MVPKIFWGVFAFAILALVFLLPQSPIAVSNISPTKILAQISGESEIANKSTDVLIQIRNVLFSIDQKLNRLDQIEERLKNIERGLVTSKPDPTSNVCFMELNDVITSDDRYTIKWRCAGNVSPCTIYADGKVYEKVTDAGARNLILKKGAVTYTMTDRDGTLCSRDIAHAFQSTTKVGTNTTTVSSPLSTITYSTPETFLTALLAHVELYNGSTIATTTILTNDNLASTTLRTTVGHILSYTSDGSLTTAEETTLSTDNTNLGNLGTGLELIKVYLTSTGENLLWLRENDATKDTVVNALFRISGYKTVTGGGYSQNIILQAPHWYDDSSTLNITGREFVTYTDIRALVIGTFTKNKLNPTGTGADDSTSNDSSDFSGTSLSCTGIIGPGQLVANDLGIYYLVSTTGSSSDGIFFVPYGSNCPATLILRDDATPNVFDVPQSLDFVTSRKIMAADRGGDQFWCQEIDDNGAAVGSPVISSSTTNISLDVMAISPDGTLMYVSNDPDINVQATDTTLYTFTINPSTCAVSSTPATIASNRGEIDAMAFDSYGNLIFMEDSTTNNRSDMMYINNAQGGGTTISTLIAGNDTALLESTVSKIFDDISINSMVITSQDAKGKGSGNVIIADNTGDEIWTVVVTRDSNGLITGFERTKMTDFAATANNIEGMTTGPNDSTLYVLQEDTSDLGTIFTLSNLSDMIVDTDNRTDVSRIVGYQTINEKIVEDINALHIQLHGYRTSDWTVTQYCSNTVYPVTVSNGINNSTKPTTFTYPEGKFSTAFNGWLGCAADFWEIFPQEAQVPLGAQTNKQGEFIQSANSNIGVTAGDIFIQFETPFALRNEAKTAGSDAATRWHNAFNSL